MDQRDARAGRRHLHALGRDRQGAALLGNPRATVIHGTLDLSAKPTPAVQFDLRGFGQWANDPLLNLEEFAAGNFTRGRGYDPGANSGDRAYGFTIEPRVRLPIRKVNVETRFFFDWVHLTNLDSGSLAPSRTLRSAGVGLRAGLNQRVMLDLIYAHPLDKLLPSDSRKARDRLLVSLTANLF